MTDETLQRDGATLSYEVVARRRSRASTRAVRRPGPRRSTGRAEPADYAWPKLAEDLHALLDVVSPDEPVDAIGVPVGVGRLLHAVVQRPGRFRRLALVIPPTAWATRAAQGDGYRQMADLAEAEGVDALTRAMAAFGEHPDDLCGLGARVADFLA